MNRLQSELSRLYQLSSLQQDRGSQREWLTAAEEKVRVMVLEVASPANWSELSKVWRGVQVDLRLPAPAIAVSGSDGLQLWFSLQAPTSHARAAGFLRGLSARYLSSIPDISGVPPYRIRLQPSTSGEPFSMPAVPQRSEATGNWSAFIAADLASVFVETPWLDVEPSAEGQADLLSRLESIEDAAFEAAMQALSPAPGGETSLAQAPSAARDHRPKEFVDPTSDTDPQRFLQQILNDDSVELALRIEAAKGLMRFAPKGSE